jgi:hypothetical protein
MESWAKDLQIGEALHTQNTWLEMGFSTFFSTKCSAFGHSFVGLLKGNAEIEYQYLTEC